MADVEAALDHAKAQFAAKRPKTHAMHKRAAHVMPGGNTRTVLFTAPFPLRVETASGSTITDIDGHSYLDLLGEYSAGIYGHSHPRILEAARAALDKGLNYGAHHEGEVKLAEVVTQRFNMDLVRFTNSGTEANMMALAAARCFTGRSKIMPMAGGYHGGTLYFSHGASPVNAPFDCVMGEYNDIETTRKLIADNADQLAAVILEPMLGGGGGISASPAFLAMLRAETQTRGIVLIFDEVMTSRLHPGGLSAKVGIEPDLKTLGKYVGGGMSFGAFGGRADIMALFDPTSPTALPHAGTFNNNTLTMNVGHVAMTEIYTPAACAELNARGDRLREKLNDLFMRYQVKMKAMGQGSMIVIHPTSGEISTPHDIEDTDKRLRQLLFLDLLEQGIYIAERGFMALSLMVTDADCDRVVRAVEDYVNRRRELLV
ncbi:aspartate aminotransferase family protein [Aestuariivirga litoralis]|uniref:Aspartate aminotransferase family protein n=1 Tax=Aestuariivirga litoralis TaxID=2650924 RepID=A0A2W2ANA4_9HYPH|nr:aminotransferase class III-fold pyridoxal phosphate-dependent enzyme [Aestuariivirga litoralis]PZF76861.1 aspartate aminotransferase family protein [Aestuariivirga litoralis]